MPRVTRSVLAAAAVQDALTATHRGFTEWERLRDLVEVRVDGKAVRVTDAPIEEGDACGGAPNQVAVRLALVLKRGVKAVGKACMFPDGSRVFRLVLD
jgi:hypothetical protein